MSAYTCIACRLVFVDGTTQRAHYKTDWHRYNLKRKVADLPPVSAENFRQRVVSAQQMEVTEDKSSLQCGICGKCFNTQGAMQNHLQSKKHKEAAAREAKKPVSTEEKENEKNKQHLDKSVESSTHAQKDLVNQALKDRMSTATGPPSAGATGGNQAPMDDEDTDDEDVESVDSFGDEEGMGIEECLFCSQISTTLETNMEHMSVKHGFFIPDVEYLSELEGLISYLGQKIAIGHVCLWCNEKGKGFHSTKSVQQHMVSKGHCKMLHEEDVLLEYADFYDYRSSYPDYDPSTAGKEGEAEDMEVDEGNMDLGGEGYELVLPSGATIGHRSLQKYYRQNINPRSAERTRSVLPRMLAQYKALGWTGARGAVAERRVKDLGAVQRMKNRFYMKMGTKANKFQTYYRPQVVF